MASGDRADQPDQPAQPAKQAPLPSHIAEYTVGGETPVQGEGRLPDGRHFTFRARHDAWSFGVASTVDEAVTNPTWEWNEPWGDRPEQAGYMPEAEARAIIESCADMLAAGMSPPPSPDNVLDSAGASDSATAGAGASDSATAGAGASPGDSATASPGDSAGASPGRAFPEATFARRLARAMTADLILYHRDELADAAAHGDTGARERVLREYRDEFRKRVAPRFHGVFDDGLKDLDRQARGEQYIRWLVDAAGARAVGRRWAAALRRLPASDRPEALARGKRWMSVWTGGRADLDRVWMQELAAVE